MRSAQSWIGVSGFLISCASRRATSRHAATFCVRISGVTSSNTSTAPRRHALFALQRRRRGSQVQLPAVAGQGDLVGRRVAACRVRLVQQRPQRVEILAREQLARPACRSTVRSTASSRQAAPLIVSIRSSAPIETTPVAMRSRIVSIYRRRSSSCRFFRSSVFWLVCQLRRHRVERLDERAELVARLRLDAVIEMSRANLARALGEHLHGPRDALGQVEAHPRRADQDHQRHHQEEREVHALQRPRQEAQPAVVLVGRDDALRFDGQLAGQLIARDDDARRLPGHRIDDERAGLHQLAAAGQRLVRDAGAPLRNAGCQRIARRVRLARRSPGGVRRRDADRLPAGELVDVDPPHARRRDPGLQQAPDALDVARADHLGRDRPRNGRRVLDDGVLALRGSTPGQSAAPS